MQCNVCSRRSSETFPTICLTCVLTVLRTCIMALHFLAYLLTFIVNMSMELPEPLTPKWLSDLFRDDTESRGPDDTESLRTCHETRRIGGGGGGTSRKSHLTSGELTGKICLRHLETNWSNSVYRLIEAAVLQPNSASTRQVHHWHTSSRPPPGCSQLTLLLISSALTLQAHQVEEPVQLCSHFNEEWNWHGNGPGHGTEYWIFNGVAPPNHQKLDGPCIKWGDRITCATWYWELWGVPIMKQPGVNWASIAHRTC